MEPELHGPHRHSGRSRQRAPQAALQALEPQRILPKAWIESLHRGGSLAEGQSQKATSGIDNSPLLVCYPEALQEV